MNNATTNNTLVKKEEFRWSFRKKGTQVFNICTRLLLLFGFAALITGASNEALANPVGGTVVGGAATISSSGTKETIDQTSENAIINWSSFNIANGETTQFIQPNSSATALNRIFNSGELSYINGNLTANGHIIIVNPNGVIIGKHGNINTAGFIATTADIANAAFMNTTNGIYNFNVAGNANAQVVNKGTITVADEGLVALVAPTVRNDGIIQGNLSTVQLGAADTFGVDFYGDGLFSLAVGSSTNLKAVNNGQIITPGGKVLMTAAAASNVVDSVINNTGVIEANAMDDVNGQIVLKAPGATTTVSGTLEAQGGSIETSGDIVNVSDSADIEATNWLIDPKNIEIGTTAGTSLTSTGSTTGTSFLSATSLDADLNNGGNITVSTSGSGNSTGNITIDSGVNVGQTSGTKSATLILDTSGDTGTGSGNVIIDGTIGATVNNDKLGLTVTAKGDIDINNTITTNGNAVNLTSSSGTINLGSTITTNGGSVTFNNATALSADATITTTSSTNGGAVNFDSTVDGAHNLTVNNGNGAVTFQNAVGGATALSSLAVSGSGTVTLDGNVTTTGVINLSGPVALGGNDIITSTASNGDITTGSLTLSSTNGGISSLTVNSAGALTVNGNIDVTNVDQGSGNDHSAASVSLTAANAVDVTGTTTVSSTDAQQPNIGASASLSVTSTNSNITLAQGASVTSTESETQTGGTNIPSTASATLTAGKGNVTVNSGGISVAANAANTTTDATGSNANASLTIKASGAISLDGAVSAIADVNSSTVLAAGSSSATVDIESSGNELYFSQAPVAQAYDSQNATGANLSDNYNGLNYSNQTSTNSSVSTQASTFTVPAGDYYNTTTGQVQNSKPNPYPAAGWAHNTGNATTVDYTTTVTIPAGDWYNPTTGAIGFYIGASYAIANTNITVDTANTTTTTVASADQSSLTLSGVHTIVVSDDFTKTYGTDDTSATGTASLYVEYDNPITHTDTETAVPNDVTIDLDSLGFTRTATLTTEQVNTTTGYDITLTGSVIGSTVNATDGNKFNVLSGGDSVLYINPATITVVANDVSKTYGTDDSTATDGIPADGTGLSYSETGLVNTSIDNGVIINDTLTGALSRADYGSITGEQANTSYAINLGSLAVGTGAGNYNPIVLANNGAALTINPATITVAANDVSKTYGTDDSTATDGIPADGTGLSYSETGLVNTSIDNGVIINDTLTGALSRADYGSITGEQANTSYAINLGSLAVGTGAGNYNPIVLANNGAALTINPASLAIAANDQTKTYGTNDPNLTYSETGLVTGVTADGVKLNDDIVGVLYRADYGTVAGEQVGSYTISGIGGPLNFWDYTTTFKTGTLTIDPATLTITAATNLSKTYGVDDPTLTYTDTGLVDKTVDGVKLDDTITGALSRADYGTLAGEQVGSYAIGLGNLGTENTQGSGKHTTTVNNSGDYTIVLASNNAALTINPATLTVAADDQSKNYGTNDPTLTYNTDGAVVSGVVDTGTILVDGVAINDTLTVSLNRAGDTAPGVGTLAGEQVGSYPITGTVTVTNADLTPGSNTNVNADYIINGVANSNAVTPATLTINPATLTVAADDQSKNYGTNDPTLTYNTDGTVASGVVDTGTILVDGVAINDTLTVSLNRAGDTAPGVGTLLGEQAGNYAITGTVTVTNADLTPGSNTNVNADYIINGVANSNAVTPATLTINPVALTVSADDKTITQGQTVPAGTVTYTGFVTGVTADGVAINDTVASLTTLPTVASAESGAPAIGTYLGNYTASGAVDPDYTISYVAGNLTVNALNFGINNLAFDSLGRPIISVADQVINFWASFEPHSSNPGNVNISLRGGDNGGGNNLPNIEPAAGGDDNSPNGLSNIEPAAGGNGPGNGQGHGDFACANDFLDGKSCTSQ